MSSRLLILSLLSAFFLIGFQCRDSSIPRNEAITTGEFLNHVKILASDEFEGRRAGTKGADWAAKYIADEFKHYGLERVGDDDTYFQRFNFTADMKLGEDNYLSVQYRQDSFQFTPGTDFIPLSFSENGSASGEAVFVGYGISAPDLDYDEYEGIDVTDKIVIALRFTPEGTDPHRDFSRYSPLRRKAMTAREKGAAAIIFVTGPLDVEEGEHDKPLRLRVDYTGGRGGIIAVSSKKKMLEEVLEPMGVSLREVQESINSEKTPKSLEIADSKVTIGVELIEIEGWTVNVLGLLEGNNPATSDEHVVVGAHYDHLGFGGEGSMVPDTFAIHNGADDNASGTAGLLEIAQAFAAKKSSLERNMLFVAFGGEEEGLLGSSYYVKNPVFPLEKTIAMINLDMIGRLRDSSVIVYGAGTSPQWEDLIHMTSGASSFRLKLNEEGFGPSDHSSFYAKDIPVLFFFTGLHSDYHRPTDDWDKIHVEEAQRLVQYVHDLVFDLANRAERPLFAKVDTVRRPAAGDARTFRAYVGTIPDFSESGKGYKIGGITPGSPADKAGMKAGDLMIRFGGKEVRNIYDYTYALQEFKPGDEVEVVIVRNSEELTVKVVLGRRSR